MSYNWSTDPETVNMPQFYFSKQQRLLFHPQRLSPINFFDEFWDNDILAKIVKHTNDFAGHLKKQNKNPSARIHKWTPVTIAEFRKFMGLILLMGLKRMPELELYWSRDPALSNPAFAQVGIYCSCSILSLRKCEI